MQCFITAEIPAPRRGLGLQDSWGKRIPGLPSYHHDDIISKNRDWPQPVDDQNWIVWLRLSCHVLIDIKVLVCKQHFQESRLHPLLSIRLSAMLYHESVKFFVPRNNFILPWSIPILSSFFDSLPWLMTHSTDPVNPTLIVCSFHPKQAPNLNHLAFKLLSYLPLQDPSSLIPF